MSGPDGEAGHSPGRAVRVLPNLPALDRAFDYLVPPGWADEVGVGTRVRIALGPRRVGGWVVADDVAAPEGVVLRPLSTHSGLGPSPELIDLARWAAWRWAGRQAHFLVTSSPETRVRGLPSPGPGSRRKVPAPVPGALASPRPAGATTRSASPPAGELASAPAISLEALALGQAVLRLGPTIDPMPTLDAALEVLLSPGHSVLVLVPSQYGASSLARRLEGVGWPVALMPEAWPAAAAGGRVVVGTRAAAFAPAPRLAGVVMLDAHDEAYQGDAAPTWVAWRVVAERAERERAPCLLVSPCPTQELLAWATLVTDSRTVERGGWAALEVIDRRNEDPRSGMFSERLVEALRSSRGSSGGQVVCVLNRTGRARLLACAACGELIRCEQCRGPMAQEPSAEPSHSSEGSAELVCRHCRARRPEVCGSCGSTRMKALRLGVSRVREELSALIGMEVAEVSGPSRSARSASSEVVDLVGGSLLSPRSVPPIVVGTEAVLHRMREARAVVFLDMDQELLAPGFRAGEAALALLARASRMVGGRKAGGRVLVQTRMPGHEVIAAAMHADPGRLAHLEAQRRRALRLPPWTALARVSGAAAEAYLAELGSGSGLEVRGPDRGAWLVRAPDHRVLCDALAATPRPRGRLRVEVDPARL